MHTDSLLALPLGAFEDLAPEMTTRGYKTCHVRQTIQPLRLRV